MEADFGIELGPNDEVLEIPWESPGGGPRYFNLKLQPELLAEIEEARSLAELRDFLAVVNSAVSPFESAKCDAWSTQEINPEEEIFGAAWKFGSYVDLLFSDQRRFSFPNHEHLAKRLTELLRRVPEVPAAAEFLVRRCSYRHSAETRDGFYLTFYSFGYGDDETQARQRWAIGLKLVENALRQLVAEF